MKTVAGGYFPWCRRNGKERDETPGGPVKNVSRAVAVLASLVLWCGGIATTAEGNPPASLSGGGQGKTVVARVNGIEITMESLAAMMDSLRAKKGNAPESPRTMEETRKEALDQLILQELAYQKAKSEGLAVSPEGIDGALTAMKQRLGGEEKWEEFLARERITEEELRSRIERNLTLKRVFKREVQDKVSVSEEEIRKEYEKDKANFSRPEKIVVVDVVFFLDPAEAGSRKKAEETLKKIQEDPEKNPWSLVSDGTFAVRDMEIRGDRENVLYEEAKKLKVGELSGVFDAEGNLHVIRMKEYSPLKQFTFEEVKSRMAREARVRAQEKRLEEWGAELRKDASVEILK